MILLWRTLILFMFCPFWEADQALMIPKWSQAKEYKKEITHNRTCLRQYSLLLAMWKLRFSSVVSMIWMCCSSKFGLCIVFFLYVTQWKWHGRTQRKWNCKRKTIDIFLSRVSLHWCARVLIVWLRFMGALYIHISFKIIPSHCLSGHFFFASLKQLPHLFSCCCCCWNLLSAHFSSSNLKPNTSFCRCFHCF